VFERYSRVEKVPENTIIESYLQGVSTRKIQNVIATLGVEKISVSYVSGIAKDLDAKVIEFLSRPVESHIPYIFVDASYFKVRDGIKYTNKALLVIAGIRNDGIRKILGARIADCKDELTWEDLFSELKDRGLRRVNLVISDGHKGIQNAVQRSFHGCSWQMCQVHFIRAILKKIPRKDYKFVVAILKDSLNDPRRTQECIIQLESRGFSRAAATIERFQYDVMNYRSFPVDHWKRIQTTNLLERVNKELKRRYRSIGAFPNDSSLLRIAGSILIDINEEWITRRRYLSDAGEISSADTGSEITAY